MFLFLNEYLIKNNLITWTEFIIHQCMEDFLGTQFRFHKSVSVLFCVYLFGMGYLYNPSAYSSGPNYLI